jgi:hypothetical protein
MATQSGTLRFPMTKTASQQNQALRKLRAAMLNHQTDLRININHIEAVVGCIAKSSDQEVTKHLPDANEAISNLRECLCTLREKWQIYNNERESTQRDENEPHDRLSELR